MSFTIKILELLHKVVVISSENEKNKINQHEKIPNLNDFFH